MVGIFRKTKLVEGCDLFQMPKWKFWTPACSILKRNGVLLLGVVDMDEWCVALSHSMDQKLQLRLCESWRGKRFKIMIS